MSSRVGDYILLETLGDGAFGKVKLGKHKDTGEKVAVKIMDKEEIKQQDMTVNVQREIVIMRALKHPNIVRMLQVLSSTKKIYIVMELVTGGELFTKILNEGALNEDVARRFFQQLVDGVAFCHEKGVCHRDLKPENLLLDGSSDALKITDFGLSAMKGSDSTEELLHTQCGSPNYCAPEIIAHSKKGYNGYKVDTWSCGVILFALLAGYLPFYDENTAKLFKMIQFDDVKFPKKFPAGAKDLVRWLLTKSPEKRPSLVSVRKHPWFKMNYSEIDAAASASVAEPTAEDSKEEKDDEDVTALAAVLAAAAKEEAEENDDDNGHNNDEEEAPPPPSRPEDEDEGEDINEEEKKANLEAVLHRASTSRKIRESIFPEDLTPKIQSLVSAFMELFDIDTEGGLMKSASFSSKNREGDKFVRECMDVSEIWYSVFLDGLKGDADEQHKLVNILHVTAFEQLLAFWHKRMESIQEETKRRDWWNVSAPVSPSQEKNVRHFLSVLEPSRTVDTHDESASALKKADSPKNSHARSASPESDRQVAKPNKNPPAAAAKPGRFTNVVATTILGIKNSHDIIDVYTSLEPAIHQIGTIIMSLGATNLLRKRGEKKMKCDYMKMHLSVNFQEDGPAKTLVLIRKAKGDKSKSDSKTVHDFVTRVREKYDQRA